MAIDYAVSLDCDAKRHFGNGDAARGHLDILERLKARNRAAAFREFATQKGLPEVEPVMTVQTVNEHGLAAQKQISVVELDAQARPLDEHASACTGCPANFLSQPYGCFGAINYPVALAGETWLLSRMQPPGTMGAQLCAEFMAEFKVTGEAIRRLREAGFYELKKAVSVPLIKGFLKNKSLSADQLLETLFQAGGALLPGHCFGILLWLGAIRVDGVIPVSLEDKTLIQKLMSLSTREKKAEHTKLEIGPPIPGAAAAFQNLVAALYLCWVHDVPLYLSS